MALYSLVQLSSGLTFPLAPHSEVQGSTPTKRHRGRASSCRTLIASLQAKVQTLIIAFAVAAALATLVLVFGSGVTESPVSSSPPDIFPSGLHGAGVGRVLGFERQELMSESSPSGYPRGLKGGSWGRLQGWKERRGKRRRRRGESPGLAAESMPGESNGGSREEGEGSEESREGSLPSFAYSISGYAEGDGSRIARLLSVVYHPRNAYCVHLDAATREEEMEVVRRAVSRDPLISATGNVFIVEKRALVAYLGPATVAMYLHCAAILLERRPLWDWFINLSSFDYPLVTQNDLMFAFKSIPRNLSFINHDRIPDHFQDRATNIYVEESLATENKTLLWTGVERPLPTSFQLYKGEAWVILSRPFLRFLIEGFDAFPRILLLYMANFHVSDEFYFPTAACNSRFNSTVVNMMTHFITGYSSWHANTLEVKDLQAIKDSNLPFARKFEDAAVLDIIDETFLGIVRRDRRDNPSRSRLCNRGILSSSPCASVGNSKTVRSRKGNNKLLNLLKRSSDPLVFSKFQCL